MARARRTDPEAVAADRAQKVEALARNARHQKQRLVIATVLLVIGFITIAQPMFGLDWYVGLVWVVLGLVNIWELYRLRRDALQWHSVPD